MIPDKSVDISGETCPITFVRTKLALETMANGQILEVIGQGDEPKRNVPVAVQDHGHQIIVNEDYGNGRFRLLIKAVF